jgi:hypothetical protein
VPCGHRGSRGVREKRHVGSPNVRRHFTWGDPALETEVLDPELVGSTPDISDLSEGATDDDEEHLWKTARTLEHRPKSCPRIEAPKVPGVGGDASLERQPEKPTIRGWIVPAFRQTAVDGVRSDEERVPVDTESPAVLCKMARDDDGTEGSFADPTNPRSAKSMRG